MGAYESWSREIKRELEGHIMIVVDDKIYRLGAPDFYEIVKDQKVIASGTLAECAEQSGFKESTLIYYGTPGYKSRLAKEPNITHRRNPKIRDEVKTIAIYKGDDYIMTGTPHECAVALHVNLESIAQWLAYGNRKYGFTAVELEDE